MAQSIIICGVRLIQLECVISGYDNPSEPQAVYINPAQIDIFRPLDNGILQIHIGREILRTKTTLREIIFEMQRGYPEPQTEY